MAGARVAERAVLAQGKAPRKRKLERSFSAIPSSVCLYGTELLQLDSVLESPGEVFKLPSLIRGGVKHQHFPRSLGDRNVQPGLQTIDREARWPQIRYMGKGSFTLRGHKSVRGSQGLAGYKNPMGTFY